MPLEILTSTTSPSMMSTTLTISASPPTTSVSTSQSLLATTPSKEKIVIPFNKLNETTLQALESGNLLNSAMRKGLVHLVVDYARETMKHPLTRHFRSLANMVLETYPNSIVESIGGIIVGTGCEAFTQQLLYRNDYKNTLQNPLAKRALSHSNTENQSTNVRKDSYGCINFEPIIHNEEELLKLKESLQNPSVSKTIDIFEYMSKCYSLIRKDINKKMHVHLLIKEWPHLFTEEGICCHFQTLTGINIKDTVHQKVREDSATIFRYAERPQKWAEQSIKIIQNMNNHITQSQTNSPTIPAAFELILLHLQEEVTQLFHIVPVSLNYNLTNSMNYYVGSLNVLFYIIYYLAINLLFLLY